MCNSICKFCYGPKPQKKGQIYCSCICQFKSRVLIKNRNGCLEWTGSDNGDGYGTITSNKKTKYTHVIAWEIANNSTVPKGMCVLHKCDNPPCCNYKHLFLGTKADNNRDMAIKGRSCLGAKNGMCKHPEKVCRGEKNGQSKMTTMNVIRLRNMRNSNPKKFTYILLAKIFGIHCVTARDICIGRRWKHLQ